MNGPSDDKMFEEYLQRGSAVSQQYRALENEEVPAGIDAAVLARAADAVRAPAAKRAALRRWSVPIALAASCVLAISIVLESGTRHEVALTSAPQATSAESSVRESEQAREESVVGEAVPAEPEMQLRREEARAQTSESQARDAAARAREPRAISSPAPERAEPDSASAPIAQASIQRDVAPASEPEVDKLPERKAAQQTHAYTGASHAIAQRAAAPPPPMAPQVASGASSEALERAASEARPVDRAAVPEPANLREDPDGWLEYIRKLRDAGETERADREWREFRAAYPQYEVADDDRAIPRP